MIMMEVLYISTSLDQYFLLRHRYYSSLWDFICHETFDFAPEEYSYVLACSAMGTFSKRLPKLKEKRKSQSSRRWWCGWTPNDIFGNRYGVIDTANGVIRLGSSACTNSSCYQGFFVLEDFCSVSIFPKTFFATICVLRLYIQATTEDTEEKSLLLLHHKNKNRGGTLLSIQ